MKLPRVGALGREVPAVLGEDGVAFSLTGGTADIGATLLAPGGIDRAGRGPAGVAPGLPGTPCLRAGDTAGPSLAGIGTRRQRLINA